MGGDIVAGVIGTGEPPPIETLRDEVRRLVPATVTVRVVEDSGKTVEL